MSVAKKIVVGILVIVVVLVAVIATRPSAFAIERNGQISAPPEAVHPLINDFHQWTLWSPWEKLDPNLKRTYEGPTAGPGAVYAWVGNSEAGEGKMTILESKPNEKVDIKLEFLKPFAATNTTLFKLTPEAGGTKVTWRMEGNNNFICKAFSMFMDVDKMVGKDFETGLANLNTAAQAEAQKQKSGAQKTSAVQ